MEEKKIKYSSKTLSEIYKLRNNPNLLFNKLIKLRGFRSEINTNVINRYIVALNNKLDLDILNMAKKAIDGGSNAFIIVDILTNVIHKINYSFTSLTDLLSLLNNKMRGDMAMGSQYNLVDTISKNQPQNAYGLLSRLIPQNQNYTIGNITTLIENLYTNYPNKIWKEIQSLIKSQSLIHKKSGILSLGAINYNLHRDNKRLEKSIAILCDFKELNDRELDESVLIAFSQLIHIYPLAGEKIREFSVYKEVLIQYKTSSILFGIFQEYHSQSWYKQSLINLKNVSVMHAGILNNIDFILSQYITKGEFNLVQEFLFEWGCNSDFSNNENKITDCFSSTFYELANNKEQLQKLITLILNDDNSVIHSFISDIASNISIGQAPFLELDKSIIDTLDFKDLLYICRKILGYIYQADLPLYLVISILKKDKLDAETEKLVYDVITFFIGRDYSHTTIKNLQQLRKENLLNKIQDKIASKIIKSLKQYQNEINRLPELKELKVGKLKSYRINFVQSKIMSKEISEATRERSIFMKFAQNIPLKYGAGWFNFYQNDYTKVNLLNGISHSIEYPKSGISNLVGSTYQRATFRLISRG